MNVVMKFTGTSALSMHNVRLADPMDTFSKAIASITKKRGGKTEVEAETVSKLEFMGSLYHDEDIGVYVETQAIMRTLQEAAKITKRGKSLIRALAPMSDRVALEYKGPKTPEELWAKPEYRWKAIVRVQANRVSRTRPKFRTWGLTFNAMLLEDAGLNKDELVEIARVAGQSIGLLEGRTLGLGRFTCDVSFANGSL